MKNFFIGLILANVLVVGFNQHIQAYSIRNGVPATLNVYNNKNQLIGSLGGDSLRYVSVSDSDFPLYVAANVWCFGQYSVYHVITSPGSYVVWYDMNCSNGDHLYTTLLTSTEKKNPPTLKQKATIQGKKGRKVLK